MRARLPLGTKLVAALFAVLAVNAFNEVLAALRGTGSPPALGALQALVGLSAAATAVGAWRGARWSAALAAIYGVITGAMLVSLEPMLDLPPDSRGGLWAGATAVLLVSFACAWYLRRALTPEHERRPSEPA